jgi:hypothetical protein
LISWIWTIQHQLFGISLAAGSWFVSRELATKIRVALEELAIVRQQFQPLISMPSDANIGALESPSFRHAALLLHGN